MAVRSLNKVQLIGNLTRDPELRYTPNGTAVATFTVATNREWTVESGERREETEFTRVVSWNKLAELCSQLLSKGRKVYVEGRLQTRSWTGQDGNQRTTTEVVISDMIVLDSRRMTDGTVGSQARAGSYPSAAAQTAQTEPQEAPKVQKTSKVENKKKDETVAAETVAAEGKTEKSESEEVNPDDIPF